MNEENPELQTAKKRRLTRGEQMGLAAVIGMGIILVVGFVFVVFTIATRLGDMQDLSSSEAQNNAALAPIEAFVLPQGAQILSSSLAQEALALTVQEGGNVVVYIINTNTGALLKRLPLQGQ